MNFRIFAIFTMFCFGFWILFRSYLVTHLEQEIEIHNGHSLSPFSKSCYSKSSCENFTIPSDRPIVKTKKMYSYKKE